MSSAVQFSNGSITRTTVRSIVRFLVRFLVRRTLLLALGMLCAGVVVAHGSRRGELYIAHPHAHPGGPGDLPLYFSALRNGEAQADRLVAVLSPLGTVKIQARAADDRYADVPDLALASDERIGMKPGAAHRLLLLGLARPVKVGAKLPATLVFERAGLVPVVFHVQAP